MNWTFHYGTKYPWGKGVTNCRVDYGDGVEYPITEDDYYEFFRVMRSLEIAAE